MQTRFVKISHHETIPTLLPYVLAAIATLGEGSVVAVNAGANDSGLQLTLPSRFMDFLVEAIRTYDGATAAQTTPIDLGNFPLNKIYMVFSPSVRAAAVKEAIEVLGICPPDIRLAVIVQNSSDAGRLVASGPPNREPYFQQHVRDNILSLLGAATPSPVQ
jgi:hypothetical protein